MCVCVLCVVCCVCVIIIMMEGDFFLTQQIEQLLLQFGPVLKMEIEESTLYFYV